MPLAFRPNSFLARLFNQQSGGSGPPAFDMSQYLGYGMGSLFKPAESLAAYGDNTYLYRAVLTIAMELGRTKFTLRKYNTKKEIIPVEKHQALDTLAHPQTSDVGKATLTAMTLKVITGMHLMLNGECFWLLLNRLRANGAPTYIKPLLPQNMVLDMTDEGEIIRYKYRVGGKEFTLDPLDVVHFKMPDPANFYRGHSPVQGIRYAVDTHKEADIMNWKHLRNNAVPGGVITTESAMNDEQLKRYRAQWEGMHRGSDNANRIAFMPKGMDFKAIQQTNQEMQYVEGKQTARDEILATYGIGLEILGKTDSQTRANAEAAIFVFQRFGVLPYLELVKDTLDNDYLITFPNVDGMEFAFPDPVPENTADKRDNFQIAFGVGAITPNEVRKQLGMEPLTQDGMDVPYLPYNFMPVGAPPVAPNVPLDNNAA